MTRDVLIFHRALFSLRGEHPQFGALSPTESVTPITLLGFPVGAGTSIE
jgi:hypothetical protein